MTMKGFGEGVLQESRVQARTIRNGGRGNGAGGGSMQTLNEGIAYMNGDGVDAFNWHLS